MTKLTDPAVATAATLEATDIKYLVRPTDITDDAAGSQYSSTQAVERTDIKSHVQVANVAALATLTGYVDGDVVEVKGYAAAEGVGGGPFYLDTSGALGAAAQNTGTIFAADASFPANSYWLRKMDNTLVYTPEMFGGVSDDTAEAVTAIQALFDAMDVLNTPTVVQPTVEFTEGIAYKCSTPVTCKEDINIKMTTPIKYYGSESTGAIVVGTSAVENKNVTLEILVDRATVSDWTSEASIGAKLFNNRSSKISVGATGFTIGAQFMGRGLRFADNVIKVGKLTDNKYGMDFTNETDGVAGACQDNIVEGGYVSVGTGVRSAIARYGVRIGSLDVSASINFRNKFLGTSFELDFATSTPADAIPCLVEDGDQNETISCLHKGNSPDFAVCKNSSSDNVFGHAGTSGTLDEQDSAVGNLLRFLGNERDNGPFRQIFDSGPMQDSACLSSATQTHIPRVHLTTSATGTNGLAQSSITTFVEPTFATDFTTDELIHTAHSRINGDVVYLTTSVADLPDPLAIDTRYYVTGATANRFQLSISLGGGPVTLTDNGTGTHVYHSPHRYVEMDTTRALGVTVDTQTAKQFSVVNDFEVGFGGNVRVRAFDANGNILTDNPSPAHVIGSGTTFDWTPGTYGGHYTSSSDITGEVFFRVGTDVKSIDVLMSGGTSVIRIRRFSLFTIEVDVAPTVTIAYDEGPVGTNWGTFAPTLGVWEAGRTILNVAPSASSPRLWTCTVSGTPGTWTNETDIVLNTPEGYGAIGDDSTDDTVAIQAALDSGLKKIRVEGTYRASGLDLSASNTTVVGGGTITLIDSSTDSELFLVSGNFNTLRGLTLKGNPINPPAVSSGSPLVVSGNDNRIDQCVFFDATNTDIVTQQNNCWVTGQRNIVTNCASTNAGYYSFLDGGADSDNTFINCYARRGTTLTGSHITDENSPHLIVAGPLTAGYHVGWIVTNVTKGESATVTANTTTTVTGVLSGAADWDIGDNYRLGPSITRGFGCGGGSSLDGVSCLVDGINADAEVVIDWASDESPRVVEQLTMQNTDIRATGEGGFGLGCKLAHVRRSTINNCHIESTTDAIGEGLVLGERLHEVVITNSLIKGAGGSASSTSHVQMFDTRKVQVNVNSIVFDNCQIGGHALDPDQTWDAHAIDLFAFKLTLRNCLVTNFSLAAILMRPSVTGVVQLGLNTPPAATGSDDVYGIGASPTGAWAGKTEHTLAWDFSSGVWLFEDAGSDLKYDTRVWDQNTSDWYQYINASDGWVSVADDLFGIDIHGCTFIGYRNTTPINAFLTSSPTTEQYDKLLRRSDLVRFYDNKIVNLGSGGVQLCNDANVLPILQQKGPGRWHGTAAPTAGTWVRGDVVERSDATSAATAGWVCTVGGTPGTWVAMAVLA